MNSHYIETEIAGLKVIEVPGDPSLGTIVLLHGFGADHFDLFPLNSIYKGPRWIFPQGPLPIPFSSHHVGRAWFPINISYLSEAINQNRCEDLFEAFPPNFTEAYLLLENFLNTLNLSKAPFFLGGFSQGAVLAVEWVLNSSHPCDGLLIFSGTYTQQFHWKEKVSHRQKMRFFQSHGTFDTLLPLSNAQQLEKLLIDGGMKGSLNIFNGGHEIPQEILFKLSSFLLKFN